MQPNAPWCLLLLVACGQARPRVDDARRCVAWKNDIQPLFAERCAACHSGAAAAAGYRVDDYLSTIAGDAAIAGDRDSRLLLTLEPSLASAPHAEVSDVYFSAESWVVDCALSYSTSPIHPPGIADPKSADFHGLVLANSGWNLSTCAECHGADFSGGKADASCTSCHAGGPTECGTCHGMPPETGAHLAHTLGATVGKAVACAECHRVPAAFDAPGHLSKTLTVDFEQAALSPSGRWDGAAQSCAVYCHNPAPTDTRARTPVAHWSAGSAQAECGSCHGIPPEGHSSAQCNTCHGDVTDSAGALLNQQAHVDGHVQLGDGSGTCSACHGDAASAAPMTGAHRSHVLASHDISAPVACHACHETPARVTSVGHLDSGPPAEVILPGWNRDADTCTSACHGVAAAPQWRGDPGDAAVCGSCHALPPSAPIHFGAVALTSCVSCHADSVDSDGAIVVGGGKHINGTVDWRPR